jgi:uncharacterized membrane protein YeaQ/YmgE (transglycosylase-associated protein family)
MGWRLRGRFCISLGNIAIVLVSREAGVGRVFGLYTMDSAPGIIASTLGAVLVLALYRTLNRRRLA